MGDLCVKRVGSLAEQREFACYSHMTFLVIDYYLFHGTNDTLKPKIKMWIVFVSFKQGDHVAIVWTNISTYRPFISSVKANDLVDKFWILFESSHLQKNILFYKNDNGRLTHWLLLKLPSPHIRQHSPCLFDWKIRYYVFVFIILFIYLLEDGFHVL